MTSVATEGSARGRASGRLDAGAADAADPWVRMRELVAESARRQLAPRPTIG